MSYLFRRDRNWKGNRDSRMMMKLLILYFVLTLAIHHASTGGEVDSYTSISELESPLNSSRIDLYSSDIHLFLTVQTKQKILNPEMLWTAFKCSLTGNILDPPADLHISIPTTTSFPNDIFSEAKFALDEKYHFKYKYILLVTSYESGYVHCEDNLSLGLKSKDVLHTAGYLSSVVARFAVGSVSTVLSAIREHAAKPSLIFVDSDKIGDPEMTIRFESKLPHHEKTLLKYASEFIEDYNLTVRYVRGSTYCPSEREGNFTWPMTKIGRRTAPIEPCLDDKGFIGPSRRCIGNQLEGAHWEPIDLRTCLIKPIFPSTFLDFVFEESPKTLEGTRELIEDASQLGAAQINLASIGLNIAARKSDSIGVMDILEVVDALLGVEKEVLKRTAMTSSSLETILDIIDQKLFSSNGEQFNPIIRKHLSAVSFRNEDSYRGFTIADTKTVTLFGVEESFDLVLESQPVVAVYPGTDSINQRMVFLVMENDALFRSFDQRVRVVGPVVGIGIQEADMKKTLLISFKMDGNYSSEPKCAVWNPKTDTDWSTTSAIISSGVATVKNGRERMRVCSYNVIHSGFIFFTQVCEEESFDSTLFKVSESTKPKMELRFNKLTSNAFLTVKNYEALQIRGPVIDALKCSMINDEHWRFYPFGMDTKAEEILHEQAAVSSKHLNDWKIFEVSHSGHGILKCEDKLGLGLVSNDVLVTSQNIAVVNFEKGPFDNLDEIAFNFPFTYGKSFKMSVRILPSDSDSFLLGFSQFSEKNHTKFLQALETLSSTLESDYKLRKSYIRSQQECPAVKETASWPTTPGYHYAAPLDPIVDSYNRLSPMRLCLGSYEEGFFWEEEPNITHTEEISLERAELLKHKAELDDKMKALSEIARIISRSGKKNLNEAEIWIVQAVLKDAAHEVKEKGSKLRNVTSLAIIVDALQMSGNHLQGLAANSTSILIREPINVLLASSVTSNPVNITMPHFSAFAAALDGHIKGFELYEYNDKRKYIKVWDKSFSVHETESRSMIAAAYISNEMLQNVTMVATIFQDDSLFYPPTKGILNGPIVGVALFSKDELLEHDEPTEIMILFERDLADYTPETCNLWNPNQKEGWSNIGCKNVPPNSIPGIEDMSVCICTHAAYFASIAPLPSTFPDLVPVFACYISLLPIFIIFIYVSAKRNDLGKQLRLQLHTAIIYFIQLITFIALFSYKNPTKETVSKLGVFLGAMVQFCLLSSLMWSSILALNSTLKYIPRLSEFIWNNFLVIAYVCGWIIPSIFAIITVIAESNRYERVPGTLLCYPVGASLCILVVLPMVILFLLNIGVISIQFRYGKWSPKFIISTFHLIFILLFWIFGLIILLISDSPVISFLFLMVSCLYGGKIMLQSVFCQQEDDTRCTFYAVNKSNLNKPTTSISNNEHSETKSVKEVFHETKNDNPQQGSTEVFKVAFHETENETPLLGH